MKHIFTFFLFSISFSYAQEKCETPNENIQDLNTISITKCSIEDVKEALETEKTKEISTRKRHRKLRKTNTISAKSNKVEEIKSKNSLVEKLNLKEDFLTSLDKIPFHLVEQIPLFNECKKTPILQQSKCFEKEMIKHIVRNFDYPKEALRKKIEGKILVQFTIDKQGKVIDIKKKGPKNSALLKKEAERLISLLPKFIPGSHKGSSVNVKYALPIIFKVP
ncbi:TonB family C-terminal domain-containing protein [Tenacibaculum mesophilum]|uniref:Energy transducer TonB n=1 Tax=Tenacibaculum mesophilum TaxID=104268 RepID=A0ABM7CCB5_9FLAO|nr:energy transducer TonB [Tenacibaculum mesophilum]AZJ31315.1 energy transducer TonB [Tenacibaculum mesophilum]QFS29363.1 TonB family protein [Tenacibaculum mesophilum]SHF98156.1 TonB family C-terminal domain-containing protein [Tenacibaculum mesophilum]